MIILVIVVAVDSTISDNVIVVAADSTIPVTIAIDTNTVVVLLINMKSELQYTDPTTHPFLH